MPTNLTGDEEESKRLVEYIHNWLREPSTSTNTFSHLDPFAQAQAELLSYQETMEWLSSEPANCNTAEMVPKCVIREVQQLESANDTNRPICPAKWKDWYKERRWCNFCPEFVTVSNISWHMYNKHIYCNHCKKVHHSKSQQNLMYECLTCVSCRVMEMIIK